MRLKLEKFTIDNVDIHNKKVLLRVDLNSPLVRGKILLSDRIRQHVKTIKELLKKKAALVVISHQGRRGESDFISLRQHAKLLNKFVKIKFVNDIFGQKAINSIKKLRGGEALLLENVRFAKEEFEVDVENKFLNNLSPLFDLFILDAFSVFHRKQTSVTGFAQVLPTYLGKNAEKELNFLSNIKKRDRVIYVLGGAKINENLDLMKFALKKNTNKVLVSGLLGHLCLIANGKELGGQNKFLEKKRLYRFLPILRKIVKNYEDKIEMPIDLALKIDGKRKEFDLNKFPRKEEVFDIGEKTIRKYVSIIKDAKNILIKGPPGYYQEKKFRKGSMRIFSAVPLSAFSIVGGGDTTTALRLCRIKKSKFSYVSLSGGALAEYIAGKKLPVLEILKKKDV